MIYLEADEKLKMIKGADPDTMREQRRNNRERNEGRGTRTPTPRSAEARIEKLKSRAINLSLKTVAAIVIAGALLTGSVWGSRYASDREQSFRLKFGEKNYTLEGTEGPQYYQAEYKDPEELREDSAAMGREISREGIVLLCNEENLLPLRKGVSVSVFGSAAVKPVLSSTAAVKNPKSIKTALEEQKLRVNDKLWEFMDRGGGNNFSKKVEKSLEEFPEAAIVVIGRSGSDSDFYEPVYAEQEEEALQKEVTPKKVIGAKALQLTAEEKELLAYVAEHFDSVIVVLNTENPMEMGFLKEYGIDACLWTGALGEDGVTALAEVLSGKVNPSGRLPDTLVYNSFSAPAAQNLGDYTIKNSKVEYGGNYLVYAEGIYVGYRYYETRYEDTVLGTSSRSVFDYDKEVAFPFGFGLSFTTFEFRNMKMELGKKGYEVTVDVYNTGKTAGKEVVQLYLQKPYTKYAVKSSMEVPSVELAGFAKTGTIQPGEHEKVKIVMKEDALKTFDAVGRGTYLYDAGTYLVTVAANAHAAVNNILAYKGKTDSNAMSGTGDGGLVEPIKNGGDRDFKTYSVSATGETIYRRFKDANPATYDTDYQGLSRNLWQSTWPQTWNGGVFSAPSSFSELLQVSSKENNNASATVYNTAHGEKNMTLADLRDVAFDDYRWGSMLDQLTWRETYSLVRKGGEMVGEVLSCTSPQAAISGDASGIMAKYADARGHIYPSATVLAATWNTELITKAAQLIGEEALQAGIAFWEMPSLNLHRTAMGGRNCDSFSEDSFLTGKMAAALCKGLSGKGVIPVLGKMILADQKTNYTGVVVMAGEQAIRELYLKPFEIALRDGGNGQKAVMVGMNRIGPRWCGGHSGLLSGVLRAEWGFNGIVMTDRITYQTADYADILEGLEAGTDLWRNTSDRIYKLRGGQLTYGVRARFRTAAGRILQTVSRSNAMNGIGTETTMQYKMPAWKILRAVIVGIAVIISLPCLWYALCQSKRAIRAFKKLSDAKKRYQRGKK